MRRGLLAVLGGMGAAAVLKADAAQAAANVTVNAGSASNYGVLASPGTSGAPILPDVGSTTHGVIGSNTALAVLPVSSGVAGARNGSGLAGVLGSNPTGDGVLGVSIDEVGVHGTSTNGPGVHGQSTAGIGVLGESTNAAGVVARTTANNRPALNVVSQAASQKVAAVFTGNVKIKGNFAVTGNKAAAVPMPDGTLVTMYCQESPEPYFEDFGRARLTGGAAEVALPADFAALVKLSDYMVFLTPAGDCRGLYVSRQDTGGFEIRELQGGTASVDVLYRIVARRKDIVGARLEPLDDIDDGVETVAAAETRPRPRQAAGPVRSDDDVSHG